MQFWTNELIAVVGLGLLGFILLTFAMAWLQRGRTVGYRRKQDPYWSGGELISSTAEKYVSGDRTVLFVITSSLVLMVGAIGVLIFAFDLWDAPMYVNIMDINMQFIFVIFAIFTFMISMSVAAMYVWSKNTQKRGGY